MEIIRLSTCLLIPSIWVAFSVISTAYANKPFFLFGDSFLDAGNNNYINTTDVARANFYPYGITFFHYPTGRCSDGRLIPDFLDYLDRVSFGRCTFSSSFCDILRTGDPPYTAEDANLPLIPPFLQPGEPNFFDGSNFASAGAGALVETFQGMVLDLHMQLGNFKKAEKWLISKLGKVGARQRLRKAVYLFAVGTNDYVSLYLGDTNFTKIYTKSQYVNMVIGNITSVITEIYNSGGRKFAFLKVPPIGCLPLLRMTTADGSCLAESLSYINLHNEVLAEALRKLGKQLPGFKYSLYDFYTAVQQRIDHPSKYGFTEGKTGCCGTGAFRGVYSCGGTRAVKEYELCVDIEDHVFWDSIHLTEKAYSQIAAEMWGDKKPELFYGSYTLKDLFRLP